MKHLNPYSFYELAARLHALFSTATQQNRVQDMFAPLTEAQTSLDALIKGDPFPLETSRNDAARLLAKIANVFNKYFIDPTSKQLKTPTGEDRIDPHEMASIFALVEKFEHALAAELNHAPTYTASKRGIYSTYDLIENAYQVFPSELLGVIPVPAQEEFNEAGRALAFGLGTSAAVHLLRAVEMQLKQYYELFSGTNVAKTERNYGIYLKKLAAMAEDEHNEHRPDRRLLQMLAQIKEHYRNPLTSPEITVTTEQSTSLFGLASAIITLMAEQILERQNVASETKTNAPEARVKNETTPEAAKPAKDLKAATTALAAATEQGDESDESYNFRLSQAS